MWLRRTWTLSQKNNLTEAKELVSKLVEANEQAIIEIKS
jgi:hypothetical protein